MLEKAITKFNIWMSCILLTVTVLMFVGATLAYFSDMQQSSSVLTAGDVKIALSEAAVKTDNAGNLVVDTEKPRIFGTPGEVTIHNYGRIYPGQSIWKDPTITNIGSAPEWVAAKVILHDGAGDLTKIMGYEGFDGIDIEILLSGGLLDESVHFGTWNGIPNVCYNNRYAMIQIPHDTEETFVFYFLMLEPVKVGESVVLFDQINFPLEWVHLDMEQLKDLKIEVQAFGVQIMQLESCLEAMTGAFPDYFDFD